MEVDGKREEESVALADRLRGYDEPSLEFNKSILPLMRDNEGCASRKVSPEGKRQSIQAYDTLPEASGTGLGPAAALKFRYSRTKTDDGLQEVQAENEDDSND